MSTHAGVAPDAGTEGITRGIINRFAQIAVVFGLQATALFGGAGNPGWIWAWVLLIICLASVVTNASIMLHYNPETVAERGRVTGTKNWDKVVGGLWSLLLFLILPFLAGLDVRHSWTGEAGVEWHIAGAILVTGGLGLGGWAMISNAYFSTAVRIQSDRGQTVCRTGPYRRVRHPGYLGFTLQSLGTPLLLGSLWGLIPGCAAALLMIIRTYLEDRMLQDELPGYKEFSHDVRYRLVPGIW
jgi:protein-S-isoprenylcysteine O-methyltransferase Ste14